MKQCPKCKSQNTSLLSVRQLETLEEEYSYQCGDCRKRWETYADMDASDARDMKLYVEQQQYERGDY
jgi:transcriptional regulator NrdR family protein